MRLLYTRVYGRYLRMKISRPTGRLKQNCTQCLTAVGCTRNSFQVLFRNRSIYSYVRAIVFTIWILTRVTWLKNLAVNEINILNNLLAVYPLLFLFVLFKYAEHSHQTTRLQSIEYRRSSRSCTYLVLPTRNTRFCVDDIKSAWNLFMRFHQRFSIQSRHYKLIHSGSVQCEFVFCFNRCGIV